MLKRRSIGLPRPSISSTRSRPTPLASPQPSPPSRLRSRDDARKNTTRQRGRTFPSLARRAGFLGTLLELLLQFVLETAQRQVAASDLAVLADQEQVRPHDAVVH